VINLKRQPAKEKKFTRVYTTQKKKKMENKSKRNQVTTQPLPLGKTTAPQ
jgi:hypothetical protein